jgi:hypothetical protein
MADLHLLKRDAHVMFDYNGDERIGVVEEIKENLIILKYDIPRMSRGKLASYSNFSFSKISNLKLV